MMTIEQRSKIDGLIKEFSIDPDIIGVVKDIESRIKTTQDHYGDYMSFLSTYAAKPTALYIISQALIMAGASYNGVSSALNILKGGQ